MRNSNYGKEVLVSAYGEKVISLDKPFVFRADNTKRLPNYEDFIYFGETSAAAAQVAGGIALILSKRPKTNLSDLKVEIAKSVDPTFNSGHKLRYGSGVFNINMLNL